MAESAPTPTAPTVPDSLWLAAIVASSEDAIISKDLNSIIRTWNEGARRLFGYQAVEVVGQPVTILMPPGRKDEEAGILERIQRGERIEHYETVRQRKDGTLIDVSLTVSPIKDASGRIIGASKIARDISDRKRAEQIARQSEERFRLLASHAPVGIFLSDRQGRCIFVNDEWCRLAGRNLEDAQGDGWAQAVHPDDRARVLAGWREAVAAGKPSSSEFRFLRPDGTITWIHGHAVQIADGDSHSYLGSCIDITARKQAEIQATFLHDLGDRLTQLADPLAIVRTAEATLGAYLKADRCHFLEVNADQTGGRDLAGWHRPGLPSLPGYQLWEEYGAPEFKSLLSLPRAQVPDLATHPLTRREFPRYAHLQVRSIASSAVWQEGRWVLLLVAASREIREWTPLEVEVVENVAARVGPMIERARTAQALQESERLYRAIGESINYGIWVCDDQGRNLYASDSFLKLVGVTQEQCSNLGWADLLHPDDIEATKAAWLECSREGKFWERKHRFKGADGRWHPVLARGVPVRDESGRIHRWVGINLDISDIQNAQDLARRGEQQLRLVTDHAPIFLAHCDRQHRFKFVNRTYAERYGRKVEDILGRHVSELTGPEAYATFHKHMDDCLTGRRVEFEQEIPYATLGRRWVHVIYEPERGAGGEVVGLVAVIVDITNRKQVELELEKARDEALAASRAKDDFFAALSHELRTPLSPVLLMASDAANNPALPREIRDDFETIRSNISLEARLIDDLLDLTRIARGKMLLEKQPVDLHMVLRDALGNLRAEFAGKRLELQFAETGGPARVLGDAVRLQQVMWNLLKNAAKFTAPDGHIHVRTQRSTDGQRLVIEISDDGIGLTPGELKHIFEPFTQGEHATHQGAHRFGGLGLGLAISRNLVQMHQGTLEARSSGRNQGATFVIELPLAPPAGTNPPVTGDQIAAGAQSASSPSRVLLVEDHASTRAAVQKLLARRGFDVTVAGSATEALALAGRQPLDFVISDVGLPDGDGYQLFTELRKILPTVRGIAMSGYGMEEDLQRSRAVGFSAHLVKPVNIAALEKALADLPRPASHSPVPPP